MFSYFIVTIMITIEIICDDVMSLICKNLILKDYLEFRLTHKRIKYFDENVEFKTKIMEFNN